MTIPIVYHVGVYGTYLEWCLTTLCSDKDIKSPAGRSGNSHGFAGKHLYNFAGWQRFLKYKKTNLFVRFHPKLTETESVTENLNRTCDQAEYVIYLYPDPNSILLCLNNFYTKIYHDWWSIQFLSGRADIESIYTNWPVKRGTPINEIPIWVRREFLSYYLIDVYYDQLDWYHPNKWQRSNCIVVTVDKLLYNFEQTLTDIQSFCNLNFVKPISSLESYHCQNLSSQVYLNQDQLCNDILTAVLSQTPLSWQTLPLPSEAWIQRELRNLGYGIRCDGLDTFPTNSVQLKELLYPL